MTYDENMTESDRELLRAKTGADQKLSQRRSERLNAVERAFFCAFEMHKASGDPDLVVRTARAYLAFLTETVDVE